MSTKRKKKMLTRRRFMAVTAAASGSALLPRPAVSAQSGLRLISKGGFINKGYSNAPGRKLPLALLKADGMVVMYLMAVVNRNIFRRPILGYVRGSLALKG